MCLWRGHGDVPSPSAAGAAPMPGCAAPGDAMGGSQSNAPTPAAPRVAGEGAQPGADSAGALQPAWPSLLQTGFAHESRLFTRAEATGCHQRRPHAGVTHADPPEPEEDGSRRREAAPPERGHRRVRGCPGGWGCRVPSLPWGSPVGSGRGTGWGEHSGSNLLPRVLPAPATPLPGRSYVGAAQKDGHNSAQGQAPALELGTRRGQHCHTRGADSHPGQQQRARRKLYLAAGICLFFMVGEAVGECWVQGPEGGSLWGHPEWLPRAPLVLIPCCGCGQSSVLAFCGSKHPVGPRCGMG